jgi:hypothetical protein
MHMFAHNKSGIAYQDTNRQPDTIVDHNPASSRGCCQVVPRFLLGAQASFTAASSIGTANPLPHQHCCGSPMTWCSHLAEPPYGAMIDTACDKT